MDYGICIFADGTPIPLGFASRSLTEGELEKVQGALNDALARGDFEPDPDILREDRDERRLLSAMVDANPFKPEEAP